MLQGNKEIVQLLFKEQDEGYRQFHMKLMPTVAENHVIGVRVPKMRKIAKELWALNPDLVWEFLKETPHFYYEENSLHGFLIESIGQYQEAVNQTLAFLPYIDNWATCDSFSPKVFKKYPVETLETFGPLVLSDHTYTARYAIVLLMSNYLDDHFDISQVDLVVKAKSGEYYLDMAVGWYIATALAKQYDQTIWVLEQKILTKWVHNKAIQKSIESYRISKEKKEYLKTLRIK